MDIGTGVAIAGGAISMAAVAIKGITACTSDNRCASHGIITQQIDDMREWLRRVEEKLDRVIERPKQ